jgi:hypothetical protein
VLGVLEDGKTYYVRGRDGTKFKLAAQVDGPALDVSDIGRSGTHAIGRAGIELAGSDGAHELHIDLSTKPTGNHKLLGPDGVSLRQIAPPAGDGQSSASTQGGAGGVGTITVPTSTVTVNPNVEAYVSADRIDASGDVTVESEAVTDVNAYTTNFGIGGIAGAEIDATANVDSKSKAYISSGGVEIRAGGAFVLSSDSSITTYAIDPAR